MSNSAVSAAVNSLAPLAFRWSASLYNSVVVASVLIGISAFELELEVDECTGVRRPEEADRSNNTVAVVSAVIGWLF